MKIGVIGTGYVGLVAATCLAETGNTVVGADIVQEKIDGLNRGRLPIYEPGLEELLHKNQQAGRLRFTNRVAEAVSESEVVFIAVGTPPDADGSADLRHVLSVADEIGRHMSGETVVVTKSTVPVGTAKLVEARLKLTAKFPFHVVSNPEFLKEGAAVLDFMKPDRVVLGVSSDYARRVMAELYAPYMRVSDRILFMDVPSAEMTKYAANGMLATRISFMNEIANLCETVGANVDSVRIGIGTDRRIGPAFLFPGPGYGGSCFPKDVQALVKTARDHGNGLHVLEAVERVNEEQKHRVFQKLRHLFSSRLAGLRIGLWGLAFKPGTDDMRDAPSLTIIDDLMEAGASVVAHDPIAMNEARRRLGDRITLVADEYDALRESDALVVVTDWNEYRHPDFARVKSLLKQPVIVDARNLYSVDRMRDLGFRYHSIGREAVG